MRRLSGDKKMPETDSDYLKWVADNLIKFEPNSYSVSAIQYVTGDGSHKTVRFTAQRRMNNEELLKASIREAIRKDKFAERIP